MPCHLILKSFQRSSPQPRPRAPGQRGTRPIYLPLHTTSTTHLSYSSHPRVCAVYNARTCGSPGCISRASVLRRGAVRSFLGTPCSSSRVTRVHVHTVMTDSPVLLKYRACVVMSTCPIAVPGCCLGAYATSPSHMLGVGGGHGWCTGIRCTLTTCQCGHWSATTGSPPLLTDITCLNPHFSRLWGKFQFHGKYFEMVSNLMKLCAITGAGPGMTTTVSKRTAGTCTPHHLPFFKLRQKGNDLRCVFIRSTFRSGNLDLKNQKKI